MTDFAQDPIINAINGGIRRGIQTTVENKCFGSAVILIYAGIDAMAYLDMPDGQEDVKKIDFIQWSDRYIRFPCQEQLSGADLYGARCGMLHNYSVYSRMTKSGECRKIGYADKMVPEVGLGPAVAKDVVIVSVTGLAEAFSQGLDQFLVDVFSNSNRALLAEQRMKNFIHYFSFPVKGA